MNDFAALTRRILEARGWSEAQLARHVGASQPTINRIKQGKQVPRYEIGAALVTLDQEPVERPATTGQAA